MICHSRAFDCIGATGHPSPLLMPCMQSQPSWRAMLLDHTRTWLCQTHSGIAASPTDHIAWDYVPSQQNCGWKSASSKNGSKISVLRYPSHIISRLCDYGWKVQWPWSKLPLDANTASRRGCCWTHIPAEQDQISHPTWKQFLCRQMFHLFCMQHIEPKLLNCHLHWCIVTLSELLCWNRRSWTALNPGNTEDMRQGIELAKQLQRAVLTWAQYCSNRHALKISYYESTELLPVDKRCENAQLRNFVCWTRSFALQWALPL